MVTDDTDPDTISFSEKVSYITCKGTINIIILPSSEQILIY